MLNDNINLIALDFSMNKPAMSAYINNELYFYVWPLNIDSKSESLLKENNVNVCNRHLGPVESKDSTIMTQIHIKRAIELSSIIIRDIKSLIYLAHPSTETYLASEGLSFGSTGDAALNLAMYKAILLSDIAQKLNIWNFFTYAPITIKSTAGCAKQKENKKENMIDAFRNEIPMHQLMSTIKNNPDSLKKKINYITTIDDIVDSYFCLKTMHSKLNLNCISEWQKQ